MLHYSIRPIPQRHQWHIRFTFQQNQEISQNIQLANWVAGSYMIRDFCRHIMNIQATCNGKPIALTQTAKNNWQTPSMAGEFVIDYWVYANDLSVRASLLDNERGFFDGACLFLYLPERTNEECQISFPALPENWRIHTTLPRLSESETEFHALNYTELTDHPFELGANCEVLEFTAMGIPHQIVLSGHYPDFDRARLIDDCQKICEYEIALFQEDAPFSQYVFLLHLGDNIYGGLEHISSTALHADRNALPPYQMGVANDAYTQLLGLISHEYFHSWNVKSIKPASFIPYNLNQETYTEQLWAFEGITSYYDDLILVRSGVISPQHYVHLLAQTLTRVQRQAGRHLQTVTQSSFQAWDKYYKQDENSPNAITSYYQHGALVALCLDATIRQRSENQANLDTVMRGLYRKWRESQQGIAEQEWQILAQEITQLNLNDFFEKALYTTEDLPLEHALKELGVELKWFAHNRQHQGAYVNDFPEMIEAQADLACRFKQQNDGAILTHIFTDGSCENAQLKPQDKVIAVNGFACTNWLQQAQTRVGDVHRIHYFRNGVLHDTTLTVQASKPETALLKITDKEKLNDWLLG